MDGGGKRANRWAKPPRPKVDRHAKRWDDPDSDDAEGDAAKEEADHPLTDQGLTKKGDEDDASEDCLQGSDSGGENDGDAGDEDLLQDFDARRRARPSGASGAKKGRGRGGKGGGDEPGEEEEGLWDPLAGLAPRKKRKVGEGNTVPSQSKPAGGGASVYRDFPSRSSTFGFPDGSAVCLVDLKSAPQLNGQVGIVGGPKDQATGRVPIVLRDGTVKSLRQENLKEVLTGAVVRLIGLQGAAELNGRIAECGDLDLAAGRYSVIMADGQETLKKVKADNLELVKRYVAPVQILSVQRRAFVWEDELRKGADAFRIPWSESLLRLAELHLPAPRLVSGEDLVRLLECSQAGVGLVIPEPISADKAPVDGDGRLACRLFAVSMERDYCCPREPARPADARRLAECAKALNASDDSRPAFFLVPQVCVKALPCLRNAAACAWPLYLQLCQGLLCMDSPHRPHKAWCRAEILVTSFALSKPIYVLSAQGDVVVSGQTSGGWLLSDRQEEAQVSNPMDGQVLPAERELLKKMIGEVVPQKARAGSKITLYRL